MCLCILYACVSVNVFTLHKLTATGSLLAWRRQKEQLKTCCFCYFCFCCCCCFCGKSDSCVLLQRSRAARVHENATIHTESTHTHSLKKETLLLWRTLKTSRRWRNEIGAERQRESERGRGSYNHNILSLCHAVSWNVTAFTVMYYTAVKNIYIKACVYACVCKRSRETNCAAAQRRVNWLGQRAGGGGVSIEQEWREWVSEWEQERSDSRSARDESTGARACSKRYGERE